MWMLPQLHVAAAGWFGYGDSIGIATGDFHLMYIDENQQKIKRKESTHDFCFQNFHFVSTDACTTYTVPVRERGWGV